MLITDDMITKDPDPILRQKCEDVVLPLSDEDIQTIEDMLTYLRGSHDEEYCAKYNIRASVGIAAPQIAICKKILVVSIPDEDDYIEYALVNPKLVMNSTQKAYLENGESCLSVVPDVEGIVPRYNKIAVKAYNYLTKKNETINLSGYPAIVLQHEMDHLKGKLYYDHIDKNNPWKEIPNAVVI